MAKSSSGDFSKSHEYMRGIKEGWQTATIIRKENKGGVAEWVQIIQNGKVTFSNKPR